MNALRLHLHRARRATASAITVEPILFFYTIGLYSYLIVYSLFILSHYLGEEDGCPLHDDGAGDNSEPPPNDSIKEAQKKSVILNVVVGASSIGLLILSSCFLGPLSDKYGRKTPLVVLLFSASLKAILLQLIVGLNLSVYLFVLAQVVHDVTGGYAGALSMCFSHVADTSSKKWLSFRLGLLYGVNYFGSVIIFAVGAAWIQITNCARSTYLHLSWVSVSATLFSFLYATIMMKPALPARIRKEQLPPLDQQRPRLAVAGRPSLLLEWTKSIFSSLKLFCSGRSSWRLWLAVLSLAFVSAAIIGEKQIIIFYLLGKPLRFSIVRVGMYLACTQVMSGFTLLAVLPVMVVSGVSDAHMALVGIVCNMTMNILIAFAEEVWEMFLVGCVQALDALVLPSLKAYISKLVPPEEQGALFSLVSVTEVLAGGFGIISYSLIFTSLGGQIYFLTLSGSMVLPILLVICLTKQQRSANEHQATQQSISTTGTTTRNDPASDTQPPELTKSLSLSLSYNQYGSTAT